MSFSDPTSILIGATVTPSAGTATSFVTQDRSVPFTGKYGTTDGLNKLTISHSFGTRKRMEFRLELLTTYTDPTTGLAKDISASAYLVLNRPNAGFTNTQLKSIMAGVCGFVGVAANQDKLLGLES